MAGEDFNIKQIAQDAYDTLVNVGIEREKIMDDVKGAAENPSAKVDIAGSQIDISTGAGALVLDDYLQELSTVEQAAAQLVAAENKAQKAVHSQTGNA
jgi:hypothetical protein